MDLKWVITTSKRFQRIEVVIFYFFLLCSLRRNSKKNNTKGVCKASNEITSIQVSYALMKSPPSFYISEQLSRYLCKQRIRSLDLATKANHLPSRLFICIISQYYIIIYLYLYIFIYFQLNQQRLHLYKHFIGKVTIVIYNMTVKWINSKWLYLGFNFE